jgi:sugar/nucleoside kinase (ribokinase family)
VLTPEGNYLLVSTEIESHEGGGKNGRPTGLFIGLTTLDTIYHVDRLPQRDEKIVAREFFVGAGGPATNAAMTFHHLGGRSNLVSTIGRGPMAEFTRADIGRFGVSHHEVPSPAELPVSAVLVTGTGERAVVSAHEAVTGSIIHPLDLSGHDRSTQALAQTVTRALAGARTEVVLLDGHRLDLAAEIIRRHSARHPPVILDGGSWKKGTEKILPLVNLAVCSAAFAPPGTSGRGEILSFLLDSGPSFVAITDGAGPIHWATADDRGVVRPPAVVAVDTLGAGDVFHGAFAWSVAQAAAPSTSDLVTALEDASRVAAASVQSFGPRAWMNRSPIT